MPIKPQILERRLIAETRIFRIEQLDLAFSNGNRRLFERIVGGGHSVLAVPLLTPKQVILIREYAAGSERYELGFPKGVVEPGEDPLNAAHREMQEEIGYGARDLRLIRTVSVSPGYIQHHTHIVLARDLYENKVEGDEPEPIEVVPWDLDDLDGLFACADLTEARSIAALFMVKRYLEEERTSD